MSVTNRHNKKKTLRPLTKWRENGRVDKRGVQLADGAREQFSSGVMVYALLVLDAGPSAALLYAQCFGSDAVRGRCVGSGACSSPLKETNDVTRAEEREKERGEKRKDEGSFVLCSTRLSA